MERFLRRLFFGKGKPYNPKITTTLPDEPLEQREWFAWFCDHMKQLHIRNTEAEIAVLQKKLDDIKNPKVWTRNSLP